MSNTFYSQYYNVIYSDLKHFSRKNSQKNSRLHEAPTLLKYQGTIFSNINSLKSMDILTWGPTVLLIYRFHPMGLNNSAKKGTLPPRRVEKNSVIDPKLFNKSTHFGYRRESWDNILFEEHSVQLACIFNWCLHGNGVYGYASSSDVFFSWPLLKCSHIVWRMYPAMAAWYFVAFLIFDVSQIWCASWQFLVN